MEGLALVIFSICLQAAIGIMVFVAVAKLFNKDGVFKAAVLSAAGLAVIGLLASLLHLGRPLSALNSLAHFGSSWLSREIWFTGAFTALALVAALLIFFKPAAKGAINILIPAAALIGLVDIYAMASIYTWASIPAWQHGSVYVEFYAAAISMGAVLFLALSSQEASAMSGKASLAAGIAIAFQVSAMATYYLALGMNSTLAAQQSLALLSGMGTILVAKWLFIVLGVVVLLFFMPRQPKASGSGQAAAVTTASAGLYAAAALIIIGQVLGRYIFYSL